MLTSFRAFSLTATLCFAAVPAFASDLKTVTFSTDPEKQGGFLLEITTEAFKRAGYKIDVQFVPWPRALENAYSGQTEGLLGALYNDERAKKLLYTDVVAESPYVFFALKKSNIAFTKVEDLRGRVVGTISGSIYPKAFSDDAEIKKEPVADYRINVTKLIGGRIDALVEKKFVVLNHMKTNLPTELEALTVLNPPLVVNKFYNAFSRQKPNAEELTKAFNDGFAKLKADGGYDAIMVKELHE